MRVDSDSFKTAMRRWTSGVSVVTAQGADGPTGMTVSAFTSVSVEPPLVVVCLHGDTRTHTAVERAGVYAVNILSAAQEELSNRFASSQQDRFEGVATHAGSKGAPLLDGCLARLECEVVAAHTEGTHTLFVGRVVACDTSPGGPLLYGDGGYRRLLP